MTHPDVFLTDFLLLIISVCPPSLDYKTVIFDVDSVARLESLRALKLSRLENFRALKSFEAFMALKISKSESFKTLQFSKLESFRALKFICLLESLSFKKKIIWTGVHGNWGYIHTHGAHGKAPKSWFYLYSIWFGY